MRADFLRRFIFDSSPVRGAIARIDRAWLEARSRLSDAETAQRVESLLDDWATQSANRLLAWVTHDQGQAQRVASRVIRLERGRIVGDQVGVR